MIYIERKTDLKQIRSLLRIFPVVAILGKRQCGKTTIAKRFEFDHYFDLESPRDLAALDQPQLSLEAMAGLIVIDEIRSGAEVDLFWQHQGKGWAVEFKYMDAPKRSLSMQSALEDLGLAHLWVVYPGSRKYRLSDKITVLPLSHISAPWSYPKP